MQRFHLNQAAVLYGGQPTPFAAINVRRVAEQETPDRHTFTTRLSDGTMMSISWDPDQPPERPQRVWVEASAAAGLMWIDKPGAWARYVASREARPDYPRRFIPTAMSADEAFAKTRDCGR